MAQPGVPKVEITDAIGDPLGVFDNPLFVTPVTSPTTASFVQLTDGVTPYTATKEGTFTTFAAVAATAAKQETGNASLASIDTKLTAPLTVTGPLTDAQLRASAVPVSGPLTDAQLRATPVPVSGTVTATVAGVATAANQTTLGAQTTKINDGTNTASVINTTPTSTDYGLVVRPVLPTIPTSAPTTSVALTTSPATILTANPAAKLRVIYNPNAVTMYLRFDAIAFTGATDCAFALYTGQTIFFDRTPSGIVEWPGIVRALLASGTGSALVTEG